MSEKYRQSKEIAHRLQEEEAFEKIDGQKIKLLIRKFKGKHDDYNAQAVWLPKLCRYIVLNESRLDEDPDNIAAIIAHELGHHENYANMGTIEYLRTILKLIFKKKESETTRKEMERYADKKAIEAGCAHGLYNHRIKPPKEGRREKEKKFYMTPEEIKEYAISIDKW